MKKIIATLVAAFMLAMSSVTFAATEIQPNGTIQAEGIGAADQNQAMGYVAAHVAALRNLLGIVNGVQIDSNTTVENLYVTSDVVHAKVDGIIKNAITVKQFKDETGSYHEIVELKVFGDDNSLANAVIPQVTPTPLPAPEVFTEKVTVEKATIEKAPAEKATVEKVTIEKTPAKVAAPVVEGTYTGLIVDCRGMDLQTAMAPGIYAEGNHELVYGLQHFSREFTVKHGYVGYTKDINVAHRAGAHPLIVKAVDIQGVGHCGPVVSAADAGKILAENQATKFLDNAKVIFVR